MTEKEKMLAGKIYDPSDAELFKLRRTAHNMCKKYNDTFEDEEEKRAKILDVLLRSVHGKREEMFMEIINKRGLSGIANGTKRFTMFVRPSMLGFIKKLLSTAHISGATLIYSIWKGYKENEDMSEFLSEMRERGLNIVDLHTSGHASAADIELLKKTIKPKESVCVHNEV